MRREKRSICALLAALMLFCSAGGAWASEEAASQEPTTALAEPEEAAPVEEPVSEEAPEAEVPADGFGFETSEEAEPPHDAAFFESSAVYARLIAMKSEYPEGMRWGDEVSYRSEYEWHGGEYDGKTFGWTSTACGAFAMFMSDTVFPGEPLYVIRDFRYEDVRVGDVLRIYSDTHSVIVLEVHSDHVIVAEGNYGGIVHWGRRLERSTVEAADYIRSRYPRPVGDANLDGAANCADAAVILAGKVTDRRLADVTDNYWVNERDAAVLLRMLVKNA